MLFCPDIFKHDLRGWLHVQYEEQNRVNGVTLCRRENGTAYQQSLIVAWGVDYNLLVRELPGVRRAFLQVKSKSDDHVAFGNSGDVAMVGGQSFEPQTVAWEVGVFSFEHFFQMNFKITGQHWWVRLSKLHNTLVETLEILLGGSLENKCRERNNL